ncbi:hypothetical protein CRG98_049546, partial [Punica granatum]
YAHPCEFTFRLRKYAKPARSCFLQPCRVRSPVRVYLHASQVRKAGWLMLLATLSGLPPARVYFQASKVRGAYSLVLPATLPGLLTHTNLRSCLVSSPSLLARASFDLAGSAHPREFTFMLRKFAETAGSFLLRPCRVCSP